jgi:hypothetical protein
MLAALTATDEQRMSDPFRSWSYSNIRTPSRRVSLRMGYPCECWSPGAYVSIGQFEDGYSSSVNPTLKVT